MIADYFNNITFSQPEFFWLFFLIPVLTGWYIKKNNSNKATLRISSIALNGLGSWKAVLRHFPFILRLMCLCFDVSGSMTAQDFTPNRLEAAKNVAIDFVNRRLTDRIGIVIFSGESFTQCPLTTDHAVLISSIQNIHNGLLEDGTAIGSGLSTSVDRLRNSKSKTKVVLLLTDGENNGGLIDPKTAKEIAKAFGIRVYTIGVGSEGYAPQPVNTALGIVIQNEKVSIDEKLLTEIATETSGKYFRARDNASLGEIYQNIDALEKSKVELISNIRYHDKFFPFVLAALFFLFLEVIFSYTIFRKFP